MELCCKFCIYQLDLYALTKKLQPVTVRNWDLQVHFKVHGKGKELFGDGLAIWYAKDRMQTGPVFGNNDYFHGLAVILDTYSNHNGPHNVSYALFLVI